MLNHILNSQASSSSSSLSVYSLAHVADAIASRRASLLRGAGREGLCALSVLLGGIFRFS